MRLFLLLVVRHLLSSAGLLLLFLLAPYLAQAQAPSWQSAVAFDQAAGSDLYPSKLVADGQGNLLVAGAFAGTVHFGTTTLTSLGSLDGFVAKWNIASGTFAWARQVGGASDDELVGGLAVSGSSVYVVGYFASSTASFGSITLTNRSYRNVFVAKLSDQGAATTFTWAVRAGAGLATAAGVTVSGSSLYVAGTFAGTADFGALTLSSTSGSDDVFLSKLTDAGTTGSFVWTQRLGSALDDGAGALAQQGNDLFVTGQLTGTAATVGATALPASSGTGGLFVSKFTDQGLTVAHAWTQRGGSPFGGSVGGALAVAGTSVYVAGSFGATATFGATTFALQSRDLGDAFVVKLTDQGTGAAFTWAQRISSPSYDFAEALLLRGSSLYVVGEFYGATLNLGSLSLANSDTRAGAASSDVYVTRLLDAGGSSQFSWVLGAGYPDNEAAGGLVAVGSQLYVAGYTRSYVVNFGSSLQLRNPVAAGGHFGGSLASISDAVGLATTSAAGAAAGEVFPNPAHASVQLRLPAALGTQPTQLTVLDATGRVVGTQVLPPSATGLTQELSLAGWAPGLYLLRVEAAAGSSTYRLMVE